VATLLERATQVDATLAQRPPPSIPMRSRF
jgi:hypothetical protein